MNMRSLVPWTRGGEVTAPRMDEPRSFLTLHRQMNRLFDDFLRDFGGPFGNDNGWQNSWPYVELEETDKEYKLVAELPGLDEKDLEVTLREGVLTLKGEKKSETNGSKNGNRYSERWFGHFERSLAFGTDADPEKVKAGFRQGVLTVTIAKKPEAQSQTRRIQVTREA